MAHVVGHHSSGCGGACGHHEGVDGAATKATFGGWVLATLEVSLRAVGRTR
ncbi:hypothetical protein SNL152K_9621 [Streptomyces sp. NL15-2K]|nr:hypothetical protein SNL152K_9621 [Streptomyces sp. NL15-2K]